MFSNLLFIIIVLLLISFSADMPLQPWIASPVQGFAFGLVVYLATLGLIYFQNRIRKVPLLVNLELLAFLCVFIFIFGGQRVFAGPSLGLTALILLSFYLFGLWFFHYSSARGKSWIDSPCAEANLELRLIAPFTLPFLFFTLLGDLAHFYPQWENQESAVLLFSIVSLIALLVFFPPVLKWLWGCRPLPPNELKERLEALCVRAKFKHAGMLTWSILPGAMTAAIIGIVPRFRYVMFTGRLLNGLPPEQVEAVLAHEIGHSYRKHLILYPFIIFGMLTCVSLFTQFYESDYPLLNFALYAVIIALYFRLVFGFFSRQFEREADLHIFKLGIPVNDMKEALLAVARESGMPPETPSWHHYSIRQRVDFLDRANPALIARHHRRVKIYFCLYILILAVINYYLIVYKG